MTRVIIVPDDHHYKKNNFTFLVYDLNGTLIHKSPYNTELDCKELIGQGRPTFRPFGIASDDDYLYISSHKKIGRYNKDTYEFIGLVDIPMYINTHQILKSNEDFYVAHTSVNTIGIHGKTNTYFDAISLKPINVPNHPLHVHDFDTVHVNSITDYDNKIYFCLHNLGTKPSQFGYFDKYTYESKIIASIGYCCHEVKVLNNNLYALSSETGEIIEINLTTEIPTTYKVVNPTKTFLRGMDIVGNKLVFCGSNRYGLDTIPIHNCFISTFDTISKSATKQFNINIADIVVCIKII